MVYELTNGFYQDFSCRRNNDINQISYTTNNLTMTNDDEEDIHGNDSLVGPNFQNSSTTNKNESDHVEIDMSRVTLGSLRESMIQLTDRDYGWVVVVAVFFVHVIVIGNIGAFGVLFANYTDTFSATEGEIAWVGSIGAFLMSAMGHFGGALSDHWGNDKVVCLGGILVGIGYFLASYSTEVWHLYFTQGIIVGLGYGLAYVAGVGVVGQWFNKQRGLAVGMAASGSGFGQFVMSFLTGALLDKYDWRETLVILAFINMTVLVASSLFIKRTLPLASHMNLQQSFQIFFENYNFKVLFFANFINSLGNYMPYLFIVLYAENEGISTHGAVFISSMVGLSSLVGRIVLGSLADSYGKISIFNASLFCSGISTLCWLACKDFASIMLYGIVYGFFAGGVVSMIPIVSVELFGVTSLGPTLGLIFSARAVGNLLSAPIGGFIYDGTGNYTVSIIVAGSFLILSGFLSIMIQPPPKLPEMTKKALDDVNDNWAIEMESKISVEK